MPKRIFVQLRKIFIKPLWQQLSYENAAYRVNTLYINNKCSFLIFFHFFPSPLLLESKNAVHLQRFSETKQHVLKNNRALSSAGSERLPYKQRVGGSNPSAPTIKKPYNCKAFLFLLSCMALKPTLD